MQVLFRVDASNRMGTGHVMRCLTLADALREKGAECSFVHRLHPGNMVETIRRRGFAVHELPAPTSAPDAPADADYAAWLGVSAEQDARETIDVLRGQAVEWLIVDHYALAAEWEAHLRPHTRCIAVLDDLANRPHDCDLLVDQNYVSGAADRYEGLIPEHARLLCGPRYALLRPEYAQARSLIGPRRGPLSRVLVYYGGADMNNETARALRVLSQPEFSNLAVDLVVGVNNSHRKVLLEQAEQRPETVLHDSRDHLVDLMIDADVAIGAGGTTTWERCALGLPSIVTALAENQEAFNEALAADDLILYLGSAAQVTDETLSTALRSLAEDPQALAGRAARAWQVTDSLGSLRVAETILPSAMESLRLRPSRREDEAVYSGWTDELETHQHAQDSESCIWNIHDGGLEIRLADPDMAFWVLVTPYGLPVGLAQVEVEEADAVLEFSIDPAYRDRSWGTRLVELTAEAWWAADLSEVRGAVRPNKEGLRQDYLRAGFAPTGKGAGRVLLLTILSDRGSWLNAWIPTLLAAWIEEGHKVRWIHEPSELVEGDLCFFLGCGKRVSSELLSKHRNNLVIHESDLPKGRGWSPLTWQVLEGAGRIPVTLLEAVEEVDAGPIYMQGWLKLDGHELIDELRAEQARATFELCSNFVLKYPEILHHARPQSGEPSWYPRRTPADSQIDPDKPLIDQFNLLRVVDNAGYPAFFRVGKHSYRLLIHKNS